jgi:hypothetical protein
MSTDSGPTARGTAVEVWTLPRLGSGMVIALLVQIVVGVANGLWVDVPESGDAWSTSTPAWLVNLHMGVGVVILLLGVWIVVKAGRERDRVWTGASLLGLVGIVVALAAGLLFLGTNGNDVMSFAMTIGCVLALGCYTVALARTRRG